MQPVSTGMPVILPYFYTTQNGDDRSMDEKQVNTIVHSGEISRQTVEWGYRILVVMVTAALAYLQMQTNLSIAQLELKIERQRVEDMRARPDNRDIERIERQIAELREALRTNGK